ncbi:MAG: hypothetical protein F6J93_17995 [Oscillatoria sp. SIO1A7]|nr:hypothetical protein [Oscillatoria sp. SIO1A7]
MSRVNRKKSRLIFISCLSANLLLLPILPTVLTVPAVPTVPHPPHPSHSFD